jgi:hypothetical protein
VTVLRDPAARILFTAIAAAALAGRSGAEEITLDQVLVRAAAYVSDLHTKVSGIVAEETYLQQARDTRRHTTGANAGQQRALKSDLLLVRPPDVDRYIEFRDVFEVNGTAVRDRQERLTKLFLTPTQASVDQIKSIVDESARHNLGNVMRNVNTPMLPLHFLLPAVQKRFRFNRQKAGTPQLGAATDYPGRDAQMFAVPREAWVVSFRETTKPTLIRTEGGEDFPATGRYWIEAETGTVLLSELVMQDNSVSAIIDVSYQQDAQLGIRVPKEMRERYRTPEERVEGVAAYGRFRQFQVRTDQTIAKPPGGLQ